MQMMRPAILEPAPGRLLIETIPVPAPNAGEILVRVQSCGVGRDDLCKNFFGMNRLRGTLYDSTTRLRRADGSPLAMYSMAGLAEYAVVPATDVFPLDRGDIVGRAIVVP